MTYPAAMIVKHAVSVILAARAPWAGTGSRAMVTGKLTHFDVSRRHRRIGVDRTTPRKQSCQHKRVQKVVRNDSVSLPPHPTTRRNFRPHGGLAAHPGKLTRQIHGICGPRCTKAADS